MSSTRNGLTRFLGFSGSVFLAALFLLGCGSGKDTAGGVAQYYGNYHNSGWIKEHPGQAAAGINACTRCHEISILKVGSGVPTCMTTGCHHQATPGYATPATHGSRAKMASGTVLGGSLISCQICHGTNFAGGASANACASCHGVAAPHPHKPWRIAPGSAYTHVTADVSTAAVCAQCHYPGSPNNPAGHPTTPAPANTQPGCYNATLCHGANVAPHPVPFLMGQTDSLLNGHMNITATAFATDCATCHAYSGTSPTTSAPLCSACHQLADPIATGSNAGTCRSCHAGTAGLPKGPGGAAFPGIAGAHLKHMSLATALSCDTCHAGSGTGTLTHYNSANARAANFPGPVTVVIDALFTPKTKGAPSYSPAALTCSNVSCHGGQTTPGWQNGLINSSTQCTACHGVSATAGTSTQYNDAFGRHKLGTHDATASGSTTVCTTCHNMANGTPGALAHFKYLASEAVDGISTGTPADQLPSGTIVFDPLVVTAGTYTVTSATQGNGGCALTCHTHIHVAAVNTWTASGAPHPVPFLTSLTDTQGNGHMNATAATFAADCGVCHAYTGTSPHLESPLCSICHTRANPTLAATGAKTCLSCHEGLSGLPAGPTGTAYPSILGSHAKHMGLPTALTCNTCHTGAGSGTSTHYINADARIAVLTGPATVSIDATYNAQSGGVPGQGTAGFNPSTLSCNTVSCHGGQTTPSWRAAGTIVAATDCMKCHAINDGTVTTSQYNDATGRHAWGTHSTAGTLDCTICHDMANGSPGALAHFKYLNTSTVSGPADQKPSGTIKFKLTSVAFPIPAPATYTITATNTEGDGGCALTCHSASGATMVHEPVAYHWSAPKGSGIAHASPFTYADFSTAGYHHQTVTQAQFDLECTLCHDASNATSTKPGPTCIKCHILGSPLAVGKTAGTCLSCHVGANFSTQGPTGNAWPNLQGAHPKHLSLLTFTRTTPALPTSLTNSRYPLCEACHVGAVPGDSANTHYSNANKLLTTPKATGPGVVSVDPAFKAQSGNPGTAGTAALTCSNISCHGGQVSPIWQTGTLTVNATTYCLACHKITSTATQYNDATGRHNNPTKHNDTCDHCHDFSTVTNNRPGVVNHFKYLDTTAVRNTTDQLSSDTIKFGGGVTPATGLLTYTVNATQGRGGCALSCHGTTHTTTGNVWN